MKRITAWLAIFCLIPALAAMADNNGNDRGLGREGNGNNNGNGGHSFAARPNRPAAPARQPVVINVSRPSSGGHNQNFPSQRPASQPATRVQPSYGRIQWNAPAQNQPSQRNEARFQRQNYSAPARNNFIPQNRINAKSYAAPGMKAAVGVHHHPYTAGYVRKKLQKIGVSQEPAFITDRAQIIHTSKQYSTIHFPTMGPDHNRLAAVAIGRTHLGDPVVRDHMTLVDTADWHDRIASYDSTEMEHNHYYWHTDNSFNYCHYIDGQGYHWWGWYVGDQFFWNRYYEGRWWWYDGGDDRWCFFNDGYWWWQDPYHVDDLYCYNDGNYIPCNSANDQIVVTASDDQSYSTYNAPDNSCEVKVMAGTQDAFLYDTDDPNATQPVYLASGVESVTFSDPNSGRPLEIVLKLNDGTYDMFDDDGNSYGPGNYDADAATQDGTDNGAYNNPPDDGSAAPPVRDNGDDAGN